MWLFVFASLLPCLLAYEVDFKKLDGLAKAKVEWSGASADPLLPPQVKAFVTQDIPLYHNLVMKHIPGADPELVLLSHYYEELDRIPLSDMTRSEINELLGSLGFYKKATPEEEVPEEFRFSPAKDSPFKEPPESQPPPTPSAETETPPKEADQEKPHSDL
ncbi:selenoprotein M [Anguilla rostrata]|uniref:selenoprotein M n=1 Tax=Anguilla rostrata TaxID=7938 RepID=UPI0030D458E9